MTTETIQERNQRLLAESQARQELTVTISNGELFAGVEESAIGAIFAYDMVAEYHLATVNEALAAIGRSIAPRSKRAHLGECMAMLRGTYHVTAETKGRAKGQRWQVSTRKKSADVGEASAICTLTCVLGADDSLSFEGDATLKKMVEEELNRLISGEIVKGTTLAVYIDGIFAELGSVRTLWGWFVPRQNVAVAQTLHGKIGTWAPALPVTSINAFRSGIRDGLANEIDAMHKKIMEELSTMTPRVACNRMAEVDALREKITSYGPMIGTGHVLGLRTALQQITAALEPLADATSQRGALIWEEIGQ